MSRRRNIDSDASGSHPPKLGPTANGVGGFAKPRDKGELSAKRARLVSRLVKKLLLTYLPAALAFQLTRPEGSDDVRLTSLE